MKFRPKFNKYFKNDWIYNPEDGVGLKITGYPTNISAFIELLHGESCNPIATRRILEELKEKNVKYTTLMSHLNFDYIGDELHKIGVKIEVIPPAPSDKIQNQELDHLAFAIFNNQQKLENVQMNKTDKDEIMKRMEVFKKSYENHKQDFGPYDPDVKISRDFFDRRKLKF
jgi:hypothetical protein